MNNKKFILAALLLGMTGIVSAQQVYTGSSVETIQESAIKLVADGHYYAAKLSLERYLCEAGHDRKLAKDAEALRLVCDYALRTPGTADAISAWLDRNSSNVYDESALASALLHTANFGLDAFDRTTSA